MIKTKNKKPEKTDSGLQILFGFPKFGTSLILGLETFSMFTLYPSIFGLNYILTGISLAFGYICIALGQLTFGWLSDRRYTKLGRRKPYLLILSPVLGLSFIFLFLPNMFLPNIDDQIILFLWLFTFEGLFKFSYAVTIPYQSWMVEVFPNEQRPEVSQIQNIFNYIGVGLMAVITFFIFDEIYDSFKINPYLIPIKYLSIVIITGITIWIIFYLIVLVFPTEPYHEIKHTGIKESIKIMKENKDLMRVILSNGIAAIAWAIFASGTLLFNKEVLGLEKTQYLIIGVFLGIGTLLFLSFWRERIELKGKKKILLQLLIIATILSPVTLLGLLCDYIYPLIIGIIFTTSMGLIRAGLNLFPYIIYADISQDNAKKSGQLLAGIFTGFPLMILNAFQALGMILLGIFGTFPKITINSIEFPIGLTLWGPVCSIILIIAYLITKKYVILDFEWEKKKNGKKEK